MKIFAVLGILLLITVNFGKTANSSGTTSSDTVIRVPEDYAFIDEALCFAGPNQTVIVSSGTYLVDYLYIVRSINLIGNDTLGPVTLFNTHHSCPNPILIEIHADNVNISGFTMDAGEANIGIKVTNSSNVKLEYNNIYNVDAYAVGLINSTSCIVRNNVLISKISDGIIAHYSNDCVVENNMITGFYQHAIVAWYARNAIIRNNQITKAYDGHNGCYGIYSEFSSGIIQNNTINADPNLNDYPTGIYIETAPNTETMPPNDTDTLSLIVSENTINNMHMGVKIYNPALPYEPFTPFPCYEKVVFTLNTIRNCMYGIVIGRSDKINVNHNNFVDNKIQALMCIDCDGTVVTWEYNYWSDYTGLDLDADGIGDVPYVIDGYNQDSCPLMKDPPMVPVPNQGGQSDVGWARNYLV